MDRSGVVACVCNRTAVIAKARGAYKGTKKALKPKEARELCEQAHVGIPKADLARAYGISRETVYQYLRASYGR